MTTKEALYHLIDELSEEDRPTAEQVLAGLRDGTVDAFRLRLLTAPYDDEDEPDDERAATQEAREQLAAGQSVMHDDLSRELGW